MFDSVATRLRRNQAAAVIQRLLLSQLGGDRLAADAGPLSARLVQRAFQKHPTLFDWKNGRIHKLAAAAVALAWGVERGDESREMQQVMALALSAVLAEVAERPQDFAFSGRDYKLLALAQECSAKAA